MSAPLKLTGKAREIVDEQAAIRMQLKTYKDLEHETGLTANYLSKIISALVRAKRQILVVSRGTESDDNRES